VSDYFAEARQEMFARPRATIFSEIGKKTELFARFTTVAGGRRRTRHPRLSLKFYTEEGDWDLVGNVTYRRKTQWTR